MDSEVKVVGVEILGQRYHLQGDDADYLRELAQHVDQRMREIAAANSGVQLLGLAILTALNIANDYFKLRRDLDRQRAEWDRASAELIAILSQEIEG